MRSSRFVLFGVLLFIVTEGVSQKYTEGFYEFGAISVESIGDEKLDSLTLAYMKAEMNNQTSATTYFSKEKMVIDKKGPNGELYHIVFDFEGGKIFKFSVNGDEKKYVVDSISELDLLANAQMVPEFGEGIPIEEEIFGLSCTEYRAEFEGRVISMICTNDIKLKNAMKFTPYPNEFGALVKTVIEEPAYGIKMTLGMKSFSPVISDRSVFSTDTEGFQLDEK